MHIVLAGGGTAGHVNPLLATAAALQEAGVTKLTAVGTREGLETELVPAAGLDLRLIERVPFPRRPNPYLLKFPFALRRAQRQAAQLLAETQASAVVGFGGYVSTPMYLAAKKAGIPVVIHEQNARPGLANKFGARFAAVVAVTFSGTPLQAAQGKSTTIGLPLRSEIAQLATQRIDPVGAATARTAGAQAFDLDPQRPTLLITGGSLGALHLNEAFAAVIAELPSEIQVLHLTGKGKDEPVRTAAAGRSGYRVLDYCHQMEQALAAADLVVCRSGAGTVAEMSALGLPAIYVPLAIGNGEQRLNAAEVVAAGGAKMVLDKDFGPETVRQQVIPLLQDAPARAKMQKAARKCGHITAATDLARIVMEVAR